MWQENKLILEEVLERLGRQFHFIASSWGSTYQGVYGLRPKKKSEYGSKFEKQNDLAGEKFEEGTCTGVPAA